MELSLAAEAGHWAAQIIGLGLILTFQPASPPDFLMIWSRCQGQFVGMQARILLRIAKVADQ